MTYEERKRLAQKIAVLLGAQPDMVLGFAMLTVMVNELEKAGWKFVPIEPTEDMCMAAHRRTAGWLNLDRHGSGLTQALMKASLRYKAMLAAAPKVNE